MKNTNITMNPVRAMMLPLPIVPSKTALKIERENALMEFLASCQQSVCVRDVMKNIGKFPGCNEPGTHGWAIPYDHKCQVISNTFKRLEAKGCIISTLYDGARYYSIPVTGGDK